jgi:hypothetical protein
MESGRARDGETLFSLPLSIYPAPLKNAKMEVDIWIATAAAKVAQAPCQQPPRGTVISLLRRTPTLCKV